VTEQVAGIVLHNVRLAIDHFDGDAFHDAPRAAPDGRFPGRCRRWRRSCPPGPAVEGPRAIDPVQPEAASQGPRVGGDERLRPGGKVRGFHAARRGPSLDLAVASSGGRPPPGCRRRAPARDRSCRADGSPGRPAARRESRRPGRRPSVAASTSPSTCSSVSPASPSWRSTLRSRRPVSRWTLLASMAAAAWRANAASRSMSRNEKVGVDRLSSTWSTPIGEWPSTSGTAAIERGT